MRFGGPGLYCFNIHAASWVTRLCTFLDRTVFGPFFPFSLKSFQLIFSLLFN
jgi:hypothetical protein